MEREIKEVAIVQGKERERERGVGGGGGGGVGEMERTKLKGNLGRVMIKSQTLPLICSHVLSSPLYLKYLSLCLAAIGSSILATSYMPESTSL